MGEGRDWGRGGEEILRKGGEGERGTMEESGRGEIVGVGWDRGVSGEIVGEGI